jgi:hypothetical protein
MKALISHRRIWIAALTLTCGAILGGCIIPEPRPVPTPSPTPTKVHHKPKKPKTPTPPKSPTPRFTQDSAGDQLQKLISTPAGLAKLRAWMDANGLKSEAVEIFIRADTYADQRKTAASALVP